MLLFFSHQPNRKKLFISAAFVIDNMFNIIVSSYITNIEFNGAQPYQAVYKYLVKLIDFIDTILVELGTILSLEMPNTKKETNLHWPISI